MSKYIIKRILIAIPVLIGITVIDYGIMCLAGSPLAMLQGPRVSEAAKEVREIALGLDKPFYIQYLVWLGQLLKGNMGYSIKSFQSVSGMIGSHLGPTLLLMGVSLLTGLLIAIPAGIYSAVHQYSAGDYGWVTLSFLGSSIPGFFLSLLLVFVFPTLFRIFGILRRKRKGAFPSLLKAGRQKRTDENRGASAWATLCILGKFGRFQSGEISDASIRILITVDQSMRKQKRCIPRLAPPN